MDNITISIFANKIFFEVISEIKLFSKFKIKHYENLDMCIKEAEKENHLVVFFKNPSNEIKVNNFPAILITKPSVSTNEFLGELREKLNIPFSILDFEKKVILLMAKNEFRKNSLINLRGYIIDKNERKIKKKKSRTSTIRKRN